MSTWLVILLSAVITFAVTATWQSLATKQVRRNQQFMVMALLQEMETMCKHHGYGGIREFLQATKGDSYAQTAMTNIENLVTSYTDRGVG